MSNQVQPNNSLHQTRHDLGLYDTLGLVTSMKYSAPERSEATLIESPLSKKCASIEGETRPPMNLFGSLSPLR